MQSFCDRIPWQVQLVLEKLREAGEECYPVGGCVRDLLRGAEPHDWDLCTSALPEKICECFAEYPQFRMGMKHGTVGVSLGGMTQEITTFRKDGYYSDGRHPDGVQFTCSLREDLARRDFTVNAMAMDAAGEVTDPFGGMEDLRNRRIRCVGVPRERFREDGLRIFRALRFSAVLGFDIEAETAHSMLTERGMLSRIARERIIAEWERMLSSPGAGEVIERFPMIIGEAFPYLAEPLSDPVRRYAAISRMKGAKSMPSRMARFLFGLGFLDGVPAGEPIAGGMREEIAFLLAHESEPVPAVRDVRRWLRRWGTCGVRCAEMLWEGKAGGDEASAEVARLLREKACFAISGENGLALNGRDVMTLSGAGGKEVGRLLSDMLDAVVEGNCENTKDALTKWLISRVR